LLEGFGSFPQVIAVQRNVQNSHSTLSQDRFDVCCDAFPKGKPRAIFRPAQAENVGMPLDKLKREAPEHARNIGRTEQRIFHSFTPWAIKNVPCAKRKTFELQA
jgi:hypothetical protein